MTFIRSLLFNVVFIVWTSLMSVGLLWMLVLPRLMVVRTTAGFLRTIYWLERLILGLDYEVRGTEHIPQGAFLLAAKHQSAWETMKLHALVNDPAVVLKRELTYIPTWGWYALKSNMIPVDRGARAQAIRSLIEGAKKVATQGRPIVIFPQGTRVAPGRKHPYRIGISVLYRELNLPIVPMALNSGVYWPRRSFLKRSGRIVVEFLPPIAPGLAPDVALRELETRLEAASDRLVRAAGGPATPLSENTESNVQPAA